MQQLNQSLSSQQQYGLQVAQPQNEGEKPRYNAVIEYFKSQGYGRFPKKISHRDTNLVATAGLAAAGTGTIITFTVTPGDRWGTYMGIQDVPIGIDRQASYGFGIMASDTGDNEVDYYTGVEIQVFDPTTKQYTGVDTIYQEVSLNLSRAVASGNYPVKPKTDREYFRFEEGAALKGSQQQRWKLIAPDLTTIDHHTRYVGTWDLWV